MKMTNFLTIAWAILLATVTASAQPPSQPTIKARFNNLSYDNATQRIVVDVELISNTPGLQLFGMNARFFYEDDLLEFSAIEYFAPGYGLMAPAQVLEGGPGSGDALGVTGPIDWVNAQVQLIQPSSLFLSDDEWTPYFRVYLFVENPTLNENSLCPSLVWDLQEDPLLGGFLAGDDGVVFTVVAPQGSSASIPNVEQFNWVYDQQNDQYGHPQHLVCTTTGYVIPVSDWALFLGIALMLITTVFLYRRRS